MARIMVIDDDEPFRTFLLSALPAAGHTAVGAANGFEALKLIRAAPADFILTDLVMPYGGLATIRIVRDEFPHVGIIAMTGGEKHRLDFARSLGAHQTLVKPFTVEELFAAVTGVLARHPPPKPETSGG